MHKEQKIAVAMIVGSPGEDGIKKWNRLMDSLRGHVHGLFVSFNGASYPEEWDHERMVAPDVEEFEWENTEWTDDFSQSRNRSFKLVPKQKYDWIMWIDLDDTLINGDQIQTMLSKVNDSAEGVLTKYEYAYDFTLGKEIVTQRRERFLKTTCPWKWFYALHEVCHAPPGTPVEFRNEVWVRHHTMEDDVGEERRERNRRILSKSRRLYPNEPRYILYFAHELFAEANILKGKGDIQGHHEMLHAAREQYKRYIPFKLGPEENYLAASMIADSYREIGENQKAIDWDLQAMKLIPNWPEAYVGIAQSCMYMEDWEKMLRWSELAVKLSNRGETSSAVQKDMEEYTPYLLLGIANEEMHNFEAAEESYIAALAINDEEKIVQRLKEVRDKKKLREEEGGEHKKRKQITKSDKTIAFLVPPTAEAWHPISTSKGGIGGAETCVMEIAKRFAADGWEPFVFATPGEYRGVKHDGVEYWNVTDFIPHEPFDVLVASRFPSVFDANVKANKTMLWSHDVNVGEHFRYSEWGDRLTKIDTVIGLTDWHCNHLSWIYGIPKVMLSQIPNGIDLSRFNVDAERERNKFVYSSSPDRGLDTILALWPEIKKRIPDAYLDIFYGWETIDSLIKAKAAPNLIGFKANMEALIEQINEKHGSINFRGRVPQDQLAKELKGSYLWLYPTTFCETFCITALEMQAAGVIPLCAELAALKEMVALDQLRIPGHPQNVTFQRIFLSMIEDLYEAPDDELFEARQIGYDHVQNFTWDKSYDRWQEVINGI